MNVSHQLDALWYVTALDVTRVTAEIAARIAPVEVEDTAVATLQFSTGALASLIAGAHIPGATTGDERFELYGTAGTLRVPDPYGNDPLQIWLREPWRDLGAGVWHTLPLTPRDVFQCALDEYARAIREGRPAPLSGADARRVLRTVLALYLAAHEHRAVDLESLEVEYATG